MLILIVETVAFQQLQECIGSNKPFQTNLKLWGFHDSLNGPQICTLLYFAKGNNSKFGTSYHLIWRRFCKTLKGPRKGKRSRAHFLQNGDIFPSSSIGLYTNVYKNLVSTSASCSNNSSLSRIDYIHFSCHCKCLAVRFCNVISLSKSSKLVKAEASAA